MLRVMSSLTDRTASVKPLRERPLRRDHLHSASRDIVGCSIPQNIVKSSLFRNISASLSNYQTQLGFVVTAAILCTLGDVDGGRVRASEGSAWLSEKNWRFGKGQVGFLCVVHVVETHAADVGTLLLCHRRKQL